MEEKPLVKKPGDVRQVLCIMKKEFIALMGLAEKKEWDFVVHMVPCFLPGSGSLEVVNGFNLVLDGACALPTEGGESGANRVSVIELEEDEGDNKRHSYIVTPIKFKGNFRDERIGLKAF